jgi:sulfite exporter TauE/SafE
MPACRQAGKTNGRELIRVNSFQIHGYSCQNLEKVMLINFIEIFGIGFGLGIAGPCLFSCVPLIFAFTLGVRKSYRKILIDICIFLCGRIIAYILLSACAGLFAMSLRHAIDSRLVFYFRPLAGLISMGLGIFILFKKEGKEGACQSKFEKSYTQASLISLGFLIGATPCAPLIALLSEIALISKSAFEGALYGFAFGLGTFIPAFFITATLAGIFKEVPKKLLTSFNVRYILKIISAIILMVFGLLFIAGLFTT